MVAAIRNLASALLNHRDPRVTEDRYNLSANLAAGDKYALITNLYRTGSSMYGRGGSHKTV